VRIVFLGSGAFAIPSFEALLEAGHEIAAVVTQPDRARGRGQRLAPPPLKPAALARDVRVLQPRRVKEPEAQQALRALAPEVQVVVAFGQILPKSVIEIPPRGTVNVHASLLPRYRGAAPIQWAIVNGEPVTGVTTMLIDEGLDTGPTLLRAETEVAPRETAAELEPRLARLGAGLLVETLRRLAEGSLQPVPQDHSRATLAPMLRKQDGRIDWARGAQEIDRRVRGFQPWPGASTTLRGRELKLLRASPEPDGPGTPGEVVAAGHDGIVVACGSGTRLRLLEVQPESRRSMSAAAFAAGARLLPGERFGPGS
jgi:methionyl-tRNA formyltransferase